MSKTTKESTAPAVAEAFPFRVTTSVSEAAGKHVERVAAKEFRSIGTQFRKIIEDWHAANPETNGAGK